MGIIWYCIFLFINFAIIFSSFHVRCLILWQRRVKKSRSQNIFQKNPISWVLIHFSSYFHKIPSAWMKTSGWHRNYFRPTSTALNPSGHGLWSIRLSVPRRALQERWVVCVPGAPNKSFFVSTSRIFLETNLIQLSFNS